LEAEKVVFHSHTDGHHLLEEMIAVQTPEDYSFVVNSDGDVAVGNRFVDTSIDGPRQFSRWLREEYWLAQELTQVQWLLKRRCDQVAVLNHPWMQVWATINDDVPHLWLSVEFIVENDADTERVKQFAEQVGGIFWLLFEDPFENGTSMQYEVDIDVLGMDDDEIQELMDAVHALLNPGFKDLVNVPL
jgi:hypothetical protein